MGDPLSIIASAAGIISLGITVCQGLIDYCQAFAGQYRDVRVVIQDLQSLERSLTWLHDSLTHRPDLLNHVRPYIVTLKDRIDDLQPILDRFRGNVSGHQAFKEKVKKTTQRTLYPFKKGMISELRDTVRQARDDLSLALQVLQIHLWTHGAEGAISTFVRQSPVAQPILSAVRQDMRQMKPGLNGRLVSVALQLQRMPAGSREMSDTNASARIPDPWVTSDLGFGKVLPPVEDIEDADSAERYKTLTKSQRCNCAKILRRQTKNLWTSTWSVSWSDTATSHHLRTCQNWYPSQEVCTTKFSVFHVNFLAAMALSASIEISKEAGRFFKISPSLTFRGGVNGSSPAFALLTDLRKLYEDHDSPKAHAISKLNTQIALLTRSIRRLLREGAISPYDVDENGRTLLHNALLCPSIRYAQETVLTFRELIRTLLDAGISINEVDLRGETAFDYLTASWAFYGYSRGKPASISELLANNGAEMSDVFLKADMNRWSMGKEMANVAMLEPWQDATECGPLSLAVLRESEQDVIRILRAKPSSINELNRRELNPLHFACCWPRGIQLLLDTGANNLVHQVDICGGLPITYSIRFHCFDAIELLINAGSAFSSPGWNENWEEVLEILHPGRPTPLFLLRAFQERRRKLFELAKLTLPAEVWADLDVPTDRLLDDRAAEIQRVLLDAGIEIPKSIAVLPRRGTVYHASYMSVKPAEQLWDAGFRDFDSQDEGGYTPLSKSWHGLEYAQWLLHHGADPGREICYKYHYSGLEPVAGLTALHYVACGLGPKFMKILDDGSRPAKLVDFEKLVVNGDSHDDCHCACSSSGCAPFTILLKAINEESRFTAIASYTPAEYRRIPLQQLELPGHPASSAPMRSKIVEKVIRFETFEALQLSHTCCDFGYSLPRRRYSPEEVREIHDEWEELLSKHEDLVAEFCHKFQELGGTLTSFLEGYWQNRMDEVLKEEKPLDEEDRRRLRELGVVLQEGPDETEEKSEQGFVYEDLTDGA